VIVVDASAVIEVLLNTAAGEALTDRLLEPSETVAAPHLLDVEVLQVLRRYTLVGDIDSERGQQAVEDLHDLPILRYPYDPFLQRTWELRHNVTAYDAVYIALAEALDATLLTRDERLASAPGHGATIELV
jgi:predicted nucleic acid-binding protein